jgi:hypothetical protein
MVASASAAPAASPGGTSSAATAATTSAAFAHRSGFIYNQRAAQKVLAITGLHGPVGLFVV